MTPTGKLQVGDMIQAGTESKPSIVVAVGRSECYSAVIAYEDGTHKLVSEVPFWLKHGSTRFLNRKPANVKWAKQYARTHALPDV